MKNKSIQDLSGIVGALAGLANDARNSAMNKAEKIKKSLDASDEIEFLKSKISDLETRLEKLESQNKDKKL
jgi:cell shape-determining protein MreC